MQQFNLAIGALQRGEFNDAERIFRGIVAGDAQNFDALHMLGVVCSETGKIPDAEKFFQAALAIDSKYPPCFRNYGLLLAKQKKFNEAIRQFDKAIALAGNFAPAYSDRGICLQELDRLDESIASFNTAAKLAPDVPVVFNNRGNSFFKKGNYDLAIQDYKKAIALNPNYAEAYCGLGNVFAALKRYGEAIEASDKALSINSSLAEIWLGRGKICQIIKRYNDALESFDRALALNLRLEEAWLGRGNCFNDLKHCTEALDAYDKALALNPNLAEAWLGRGVSFGTLKRYTEALGAYDKALALNPNLAGAEGARLNIKMLLCDWKNFDAECEHLISSGRSGTANAEPFVILTISSSAADQIQFTQHYVAEAIPEFPQVWQGERYVHDRIRIAYLSSDYRVHPIAHLISEMLELHDRGKFEIIGISHGPDDESATRARLVKSFDQFHDVQKLGDDAAAALIKRLEIDIAVDLNGYTSLARPGILARRPAPVQAMYLGYPGTMGAKFIDYAIVDKIVLPEELQKYWTEKPAYLPDTFMAQDRVARRNMPAEPLTRAQAGLPENAFVFCCFNNTHKLNPSIFQVWMRLLKAVAGSVVWMSGIGEPARTNIIGAAKQSGVDPARLIFAPRLERVEDHLSRYRAADLFLDTLPYNAHTTAADALWAGLPIVTCAGRTFPGRVAGSLLNAIGLPELVTQNLQEYEALALALARDPARLSGLRAKLAQNRDTYPLFDTPRLTRHLEAAYVSMTERQRRGEPPAPFAVDPIV